MAINPGYTRRTELSCTLEEMAAYGAVILYQNEAIYIKQDDGRYAVKIGDGKTPLADLPYSVHYGEFAALKAAAENAKKLAEDARTAAEAAQAGAAEVISATNFANSLKGYKSGTAVFMDDVSPVEHEMVVKARSKNLWKPTPKLTTSVHRGITFEPQEDGGIHVYGTNDGTGRSWKDIYVEVTEGTYTLSGIPEGSSKTTYYMEWYKTESKSTAGYDIGSGVTAKMNQTERCNFQLSVTQGMTVDFIVYPQLEEGTTATSYAPYVDVSIVKVLECGKNLLDAANGKSLFGTHEIGADGVITLTNDASVYKGRMVWELGSYDEFVGKTLTFSFTQLVSPADGNIAYFNADYNTGNGLMIGSMAVKGNERTTLTTKNIPANTGGWSKLQVVYYVDKFDSEGQIAKIKELQVELGAAATEYEPYVERKEHNSDADGAVKGIVGKGEDITLYTDTNGALVKCKYNRDINKAFAELQQALISLGGNV